jgi:hypothetical protein
MYITIMGKHLLTLAQDTPLIVREARKAIPLSKQDYGLEDAIAVWEAITAGT